MISKRNYLLVTAMMLILLFMFQATGVARDFFNDSSVNDFAAETTRFEEGDAYDPTKGHEFDIWSQFMQDKPEGAEDYHDTHIAFLGKASGTNAVYNTVYQWCTYTKRTLDTISSVDEIKAQEEKGLEVVVVDSKSFDILKNVEALTKVADSGVSLVFANLPEASVISGSKELQKLLGITGIESNEVEVTGANLFAGFLVGGKGEYYYEKKDREKPENVKRMDLDMKIPWYQTTAYSKSYMIATRDDIGTTEDMTYTYEQAPQIIWKSLAHLGTVFVVNGDFLDDITGMGVLQGFMNDFHSYELYPIANAQNLTIVNYPSFANENYEKINEYYSRGLVAVYRDIIWQALSTVSERTGFKMTAIITPQTDYSDGIEPDGTNLDYFAKMLNEQNSEMGLSTYAHDGITAELKMDRDENFIKDNFEDYIFQVGYFKDGDETLTNALSKEILGDIKTLTSEYDAKEKLFSFEDGKLVQRATNDAFSHTFREDLRTKSVETVLGYTNILMNVDRIAHPVDENDAWNELYKEFSNDTISYWRQYDEFDYTTLSMSNIRLRRMMSTYSESYMDDDKIAINITNHEIESFLMLHIRDKIPQSGDDVKVTELGEDYYMLTVTSPYVTVELKDAYSTTIK